MKASHPETATTARVNPGETLRKARELNGWSLADVASQLNLTTAALSQLEAGAFEQLPGHTFARGYIRAYAKLLGMDQNRLVMEFDQYTGTDASGSSVHSLGRIEEPARLSHSLLRFASFAMLVVLGVIGFLWWQEQAPGRVGEIGAISMGHVEVESADGVTQLHPLDEPEDQAVAEGRVDAPLPLTPTVPESVTPDPIAQADVAEDTGGIEAPAGEEAPLAPAPEEPAAAAPAPAEPAAPPLVAAPGEGLVRLQFTENCWTHITDADGKVLLSGLKQAGDSVELTGKTPLELRLGYARGAQVSFNGQVVDVTPFIRGETARLKLGE